MCSFSIYCVSGKYNASSSESRAGDGDVFPIDLLQLRLKTLHSRSAGCKAAPHIDQPCMPCKCDDRHRPECTTNQGYRREEMVRREWASRTSSWACFV